MVNRAVDMAKNGLGIIALRNAGHLGRIGGYELLADKGLVSIHFVTVAGSRIVAPLAVNRRAFQPHLWHWCAAPSRG